MADMEGANITGEKLWTGRGYRSCMESMLCRDYRQLRENKAKPGKEQKINGNAGSF